MINNFAFLLLGIFLASCHIQSNPEYSKLSPLEKKRVPIELCSSCEIFKGDKIRVVNILQFDSAISNLNYDSIIVFTGVLNCKSGLRDIKYLCSKYASQNSRVVLLGIDDWYWARSILKKYENYNLDIFLLNDEGRTSLLSSAQFISNHYNFHVMEKYSQLRQIVFNKNHQVTRKLAEVE